MILIDQCKNTKSPLPIKKLLKMFQIPIKYYNTNWNTCKKNWLTFLKIKSLVIDRQLWSKNYTDWYQNIYWIQNIISFFAFLELSSTLPVFSRRIETSWQSACSATRSPWLCCTHQRSSTLRSVWNSDWNRRVPQRWAHPEKTRTRTPCETWLDCKEIQLHYDRVSLFSF